MTILAVDNHCQRLQQFVHFLRAAYPDDTVKDFIDPFRAVQYISANQVEVAFVDDGLRPFDAVEFAELAKSFCVAVKVYIVTDCAGESGDISEEAVTGLLMRPASKEGLSLLAID